ncbi:hypothetical protein [Halorubrum laminariae]|uniref:MarR family transcriptional regulator n=1 Tax=Halorubrum laminariae TaxID=1433523 RepID=A0ABD6C784_9EURY|nr:hypothetical protein [Halorubrum laminariae]
MTEYDVFLDLLAGHPGASRSELRELAGDTDRLDADAVDDLLDHALVREDAVEANGSHWVMRSGRFHPDEYEHPLTGEWREDGL